MSDQCATIKTYALAGRTATEVFKLIQEAYGELAFGRSRVFELHKQYREGRESIKDDRGKCPKPKVRNAENIALISDLVAELVEESGLSYGTISTILHSDLNVSKVSARWSLAFFLMSTKRSS